MWCDFPKKTQERTFIRPSRTILAENVRTLYKLSRTILRVTTIPVYVQFRLKITENILFYNILLSFETDLAGINLHISLMQFE